MAWTGVVASDLGRHERDRDVVFLAPIDAGDAPIRVPSEEPVADRGGSAGAGIELRASVREANDPHGL